jgi:hypothetical protein
MSYLREIQLQPSLQFLIGYVAGRYKIALILSNILTNWGHCIPKILLYDWSVLQYANNGK